VEFLIALAIYAGAPGEHGRAPLAVHRVASLLELTPRWAKAIFRSSEHLEMPMQAFERSLRDPFGLASNVLYDLAGIGVTWLLPVFATIAFSGGANPSTPDQSPGRRLLRRALTTLGPLALVALFLTTASLVVRNVMPPLAKSPAVPDLYPIERFLQAEWGSVWSSLMVTGPWTLASFMLIPTIAAAWRDWQQALAACLGTTLFILPLLGMAAIFLYPGGIEAIPSLLLMYGDTLIKLALFASVLPFALRRLRADTMSTCNNRSTMPI
jgi:hypothetical protein